MPFQIKKRFLIPFLLICFYLAGPRPDFAPVKSELPVRDIPLAELESHIAHLEAGIPKIKPGNASRIIWADSVRKTPYVVIYLHGFSASAVEGAPFHQDFAQRYGCNLYLPRLEGHGIDDKESFVNLTPENYMQSAREAIAIGSLLGEKVILMSCSTGSTLSTYLAAHNPTAVDALMMYSPNFRLGSTAAELLNMPWGLQIANAINGSPYRSIQLPQTCHPYWTVTYRTEGIVCLQDLLDQTMGTATYEKITQPCFIGYYYKNENEQDFVISTDEIKKFAQHSQTPAAQKRIIPFPDVASHVMISDLQSHNLENVYQKSFQFAEEVLNLKPIEETANSKPNHLKPQTTPSTHQLSNPPIEQSTN